MKNEYAQWRKLDNAALAFPAVTGKNDTRVFRFYCELKEEIKEETLQEALERTLGKSFRQHWIRQWRNIHCSRRF